MRNAELRRAVAALVHNRVRAAVPGADPEPIALGYQLERGGISLRALAALCAGVVRSVPGARWRPSLSLVTVLNEYAADEAATVRVAKGRNARRGKTVKTETTGDAAR